MNLTFSYPGAAHSVRCILHFTADGQTAFWRDPIFHFFPQLDRGKYLSLPQEQREERLMDFFNGFEEENRSLLEKKVEDYNAHWQRHRGEAVGALEDAFRLKLEGRFEDMRGLLSFCPICPRELADRSFDVFYLNSEQGALGLALHEIVHFVWFSEWQRRFGDDPADYEAPHLKWILSEMVVDCVMRDERLTALDPYQQNGGTAYPYFYSMKIGGEPVLDMLFEKYRILSTGDFMSWSYGFCQTHEIEIRRHIADCEGA